MGYKKKVSVLIIGILAITIIAGCGIVQVNPEKDRAQVVAEVDGEEILKGEVLDRLDREKEYYNLTEEAIKDKNNKEQVLEIKKGILDQLTIEKLLSKKATEAGFVVDDEMMEEAREELSNIKKTLEEQLELSASLGEEESEEGEKDYSKEAEDYLKDQLEAMGKTEDEYIEFLAEQKCIEKLYEKTVKDVDVSKEEIEKYYNEELPKQKENPGYGENSPITLYEPERVRAKHILIEIPKDKAQEYRGLLSDEKEDEAKKLLDEALKGIEKKAKITLDRAKGQKDFGELAKEVNPETGKAMEEGIIIHRKSPYLPEEYIDAAFKLGVGDVSDLVGTPQGYYIIKLEEKLPEATLTMEEKKGDIEEVIEKNKKEEKWREVVKDWQEKWVKKFEKKL